MSEKIQITGEMKKFIRIGKALISTAHIMAIHPNTTYENGITVLLTNGNELRFPSPDGSPLDSEFLAKLLNV